jgi:hypothetical protein
MWRLLAPLPRTSDPTCRCQMKFSGKNSDRFLVLTQILIGIAVVYVV